MSRTRMPCRSISFAGAFLAACGGSGGGAGPGGGGPPAVVLGAPTLATQVVAIERGFPSGLGGATVATADVDGDGDVDALFGRQLYLNEGLGGFAPAPPDTMPSGGIVMNTAVFADIDADGDPDVVVAGGSTPEVAPVRVWRNDGTGRFEDFTLQAIVANPMRSNDVAVGDVDGDGDLDLAVAVETWQDRLYLNNGNGTFTNVTAEWLPPIADSRRVVLADFTGDGRPDLLLGRGDRLLRNLDGQMFTPPGPSLQGFVGSDVAHSDLDGDGDRDLLLIAPPLYPTANKLWLNDGTGTFTDHSTSLPTVSGFEDTLASVGLVDVDGDGDQDAVLGTHSTILRNHGNATFQVTSGLSTACGVYRVAGTDVDGDGDRDLLLASSASIDCQGAYPINRLYLNDGAGTFRAVHETPRGAGPGVVADIDADGDLDVLRDGWLELNDGYGRFGPVPMSTRFVPATSGRAVLAPDVDADGDVDVVIAQGVVALYLNDGTGHFTLSPLPTITHVQSVAGGDVDRDGDLDLVVRRGEPVMASIATQALLLGTGTGAFVDASDRLPPLELVCADLGLADVERDGDADVVLVYRDGTTWALRSWLNDGSGRFTADASEPLGLGTSLPRGLWIADIDADGDADLLVAGAAARSSWRNPGNGAFEPVDLDNSLAAAGGDYQFLTAADLDLDGDLDVLAQQEDHLVAHLQDAPWRFRYDGPSRITFSGFYGPGYVMPIDQDGDGDLEWFGRTSLVLHLRAPAVATVGRPYAMRVSARPGWLDRERTAQVFLSLEAAQPPIVTPAGVFRPSPSGLIALAPSTIPAPVGQVDAVLTIPNLPALLGRTIHAQALVTDPVTGEQRFTNALRDPIGP